MTGAASPIGAAPCNRPTFNIAIRRRERYSWPVPDARVYPRFAAAPLTAALRDSPVVLIHGPRQCGKTTLARAVGGRSGRVYYSFDDDVLRAAAEADPVGFVAELPPRVTLDEVQRVPALFAALKAAVDRDRAAGHFLLTGSANVLLVPRLADSLAGRMQIQRLHPLAQCELARRRSRFLTQVLEGRIPTGRTERLGRDLAVRIAAGGYPAALARATERRRAAWYEDYLEALVQRDVRDLARIASLDVVPRLLQFAAGQTARLFNVSALAAPFQLSRPTIRDYVTLLERVFLVETLPPWHSNRLSRLIKTPKLHLTDTGLACALLGITAADLWAERPLLGQLLETFVLQELRRLASWHEDPFTFHHYRDKDGVEVDLVLEQGVRRLIGIEVKAAATVTAADFRGLRRLQEATGPRFTAGLVLYDGEHAVRFGERLHAVPLRLLWDA